MKLIQWFPGHMTKAVRMMQDNVKLVDAVIYVVDSRIPAASMNPKFDSLIAGKKVLYVFNKADMVEKRELDKWLKAFSEQGKSFTVTNSAAGDVSGVISGLRLVLSDVVKKYADKGVTKCIRAMVVGIPNSGKSTLINSLCKSKKTLTGDKAGVTRGKQWVSVDKHIDLLDTPGTLWASFENQIYAQDLALVGSIRDDILEPNELAECLLGRLKSVAPTSLEKRYGVDSGLTESLLLTEIARKRGCVVRGGDLDLERCSRALIDDFRKGRLGKIMLERI